MMTPASLQAALKRLSSALDQLEAASERRARADSERLNLEDELTVLQDDRTRLAVELDGAVARSRALELANTDVARRLQKASHQIEAVMARFEYRDRH